MAAEQQRDPGPRPLHDWATIAAGYYQRLPELEARLTAAINASRDDVLEQLGRLAGDVSRLSSRQHSPRSMSPPRGMSAHPARFDPELTMGGAQVRIPTKKWDEVVDMVDQFDELQADLTQLKQDKHDLEVTTRALESQATRRRTFLAWLLPFIVAGTAGVAWLIIHVWHL